MDQPETQPDDRARGKLPRYPGELGPDELKGGDIQRVSRALILMAGTAEKITFAAAKDAPPNGSGAHSLYRGTESGYAVEGFITMQFSIMSAMDHMRAFVTLVRAPTVRSTSLATVARGAHESLARTWYLLSRETDEDFAYRVISLFRSDLRYSELLATPVNTRDGNPVDPAVKRAFYADELKRLGLPAPARTQLSQMAAAMLDAEMGQDEGRVHYSALSSIAHAHRLGVNNFVTTTADGDIVGLLAPRRIVLDMATRLFRNDL